MWKRTKYDLKCLWLEINWVEIKFGLKDKPLFFQWTKNGQLLSNSPQTHYKIENSKDVSEFLIKNVDRNDSANYSCIARNAFGEDIMHSKLLVKGLKL